MVKDFGWKLVYREDNDFIWAIEYECERPAAYNDMENKFLKTYYKNRKLIKELS